MPKLIKLLALTGAFMMGLVVGSPANAQASRTWVSGVGDDVNPCSRTAPCKTFAGAISKTAPGGEINCLDPGGFGAVTITKSLTINCLYTEGGVLAGGNGITINALSTDVVYLRGLDIFGVNPPTNGVRFIAGGALHIEDCVIRRFNASGSFGVSFQPSGNSQLTITNSTIADNGSGASGGGVRIQPTGTGTARVTLQNVRIQNNANDAIRADTTGSTGGGLTLTITNSRVVSSANGINVVTAGATPSAQVMVTDSLIALIGANALVTAGSGSSMRVGNTTITANNVGINVGAGSTIASYGDNRLDGNATNGNFTSPVITKR